MCVCVQVAISLIQEFPNCPYPSSTQLALCNIIHIKLTSCGLVMFNDRLINNLTAPTQSGKFLFKDITNRKWEKRVLCVFISQNVILVWVMVFPVWTFSNILVVTCIGMLLSRIQRCWHVSDVCSLRHVHFNQYLDDAKIKRVHITGEGSLLGGSDIYIARKWNKHFKILPRKLV